MKKKPKTTKKQQLKRQQMRIEIICAVLFLLLVLTVLGEFHWTMIVGDSLVLLFKLLFGLFRFLAYILFGYALIYLFRHKQFFKFDVRFWGIILLSSTLMIICALPSYIAQTSVSSGWQQFLGHIQLGANVQMLDGGGLIGVTLLLFLKQYIGAIGVVVATMLLFLLGLSLVLGKTLYELLHPPVELTKTHFDQARKSFEANRLERQARKVYDVETVYDEVAEETNIVDTWDEEPWEIDEPIELYDDSLSSDGDFIDVDPSTDPYEIIEFDEPFLDEAATDIAEGQRTSVKPQQAYKIPSLQHLTVTNSTANTRAVSDRSAQKRLLQDTLDNFGVKAVVSAVRVGPAVTQYEVTLAPGVKVNRIVNLATDISLALAAKGVRIEAPIPGKAAVGIEVPNETIQMVGLYEVLKKGYRDKSQKLLVALGRSISGEEVQIEINKMPHLLVAGSTGSGKSVCINTIIMSILLRATPDEVKFIMVDPKKVELNVYNDIPHLLAPVVTNPKKAAVTLRKVVVIMEERYELFADAFVRNLEGYNEYAKNKGIDQLPYIVVIIDELSDLMVVAAKEVEESIMRLAQMARAAGIHLIVATQRPSVDVITGIIKSNIPSRIAFAVSSQIDSRTILDMGGAERLVGKGDMLYLAAGEAKPIRVQGAYVSEQEIEKTVQEMKSYTAETAQYDATLLQVHSASEIEQSELFELEVEQDELFEEAVRFAISVEMISTSKLQRRFRIGFNRASRIMDEMVEKEILGPMAGNKGRPVLIKDVSEIYEDTEKV